MIAASPQRRTPEGFMADVVAGQIQLPTISRVVQSLIAQLRNPSVSVNALTAQIEQDPVLSAKVLRLANSPFFSGRRTLASIPEAVSVIGTNALGTLVIASGVSSAFVHVPSVNLGQFWQGAVTCATVARLLATHGQSDFDPDGAYCAGLLSGVGHLILCMAYPKEAEAAFVRYNNLRGWALAEKEQSVFGITHPVVGALWSDQLGFPQRIGEAIRYHLGDAAGQTPSSAGLLRVAMVLATSAQQRVPVADALNKLDAELVHRLSLQAFLAAPSFEGHYSHFLDLPAP